MRTLVRYLWVPVAVSLVYLAWVFADRDQSNREYERELEHKTAPAVIDYGTSVKILQFYASPGTVVPGEQAILCYGVVNAKSVRIEPEVDVLWPALNRCLYVQPKQETRYTLTAEGADGKRVTASFVLKVTPRR